MSDRIFRLLERLQRLDERLRLAQASRRNKREIARLARIKAGLKRRMARLIARPRVAQA